MDARPYSLPASEKRSEMSVREFVTPLFRHKRLLLLSFAAFLALSLPALFLLLHKYKSEMTVLVNRDRVDNVVTPGTPNQTITQQAEIAPEEINSEADLILSRDVLEQVVAANHLADEKHTWISSLLPRTDQATRTANAVIRLANKIKVKPSTKTNLINVSFSAADPDLSYGVMSSLASFYLQKHAAVFRPAGSYGFFSEQTDKFKTALDQSEAKLHDFVGAPGQAAAPDLLRADLDLQLAAAIGQMYTTEQAVAADGRRIESDERQLETTPKQANTQTVSPPTLLLQQLGASVLAAQTRQTELSMKYAPDYPLVKEANEELREATEAFQKAQATNYQAQTTATDPTYELLREDLAKTRSDQAAQQAHLVESRDAVAKLQAQMTNLAQRSLQQADLQRERKINEDNYLLYLGKSEQQRTSEALDKMKIDNVAIATPPALPVLPAMSPVGIVLSSLVLSLILSVALVYALSYLDSRFYTPADVMESLDIPVVIAMPKRTA
jgi:uncharacterized protein involved in exopolysaccharide biosynthesis